MRNAETTHQAQLEEVDISSPPNDHLGDYRELESPYEASVAAFQETVPVPSDVHADPADVKHAMGEYAEAPYRVLPVRQMPADSWSADDFHLNDNQQEIEICSYDPYRKSVQIFNRTNDHVFLSPSPNTREGWGSIILPAGESITLTTRSKIYLFTLFGFVPGTITQVSVVRERYA